MLHRRRERSISYQVSQLLVNLFDLCAGRVAYPVDEPESVEAKTTVDELLGRYGRELPTLHPVDTIEPSGPVRNPLAAFWGFIESREPPLFSLSGRLGSESVITTHAKALS
jgi:hypothetical protein